MTFYLKPLDGTLPILTFQKFAECRLHHLSTLRNYEVEPKVPNDLLPYSACLIEGSMKDRLSHFILRLASSLHSSMHSYVTKKEELLFLRRLSKMDKIDVKKSIKDLMKQLHDYEKCSRIPKRKRYFHDVQIILAEIMENDALLDHVKMHANDCQKGSLKNCEEHKGIAVPFAQVLPQVANREVSLINGKAYLRCDQVVIYLKQLFLNLMEQSSEKMRQMTCISKLRDDPRITDLLKILENIYKKVIPFESGASISFMPRSLSVTLDNLDKISEYFPPCMRSIHLTLRSRHRLCHRPRVQYTLYLKEIGLPVQHFLDLLETEYTKDAVQTDANQKHKCEHSWQKDSARYNYGTRHLYGLKGANKNYTAHSCRTIQNATPGPNECGGCPFSHFDGESLETFCITDLQGKENAKGFLSGIKDKKLSPIESCHAHLRFKANHLLERGSQVSQELKVLDNSQVKIHSVFKPKHYFTVMCKMMDN